MMPPDEHKPLKRTILPYYAIAATSLVLVSVLCLVSATEFTGHYFNPKILGVTHLFILGWATMIIFGASNQLTPVLTENRLYSERLPVIIIILKIAGIALLVFSFWNFLFNWITYSGGLLIILSIALHAYNIFKTSVKTKDNISADFILSAHIWLLVTAIAGFLLLVNLRYPFLQQDHLQYLKMHASLGMAGWFLQLIVGVSSRLIPMFLLSHYEGRKNLNITYYCINFGLIFFFAEGLICGSLRGKLFSAIVIMSGLVSYFNYVRHCYKSALKKHLDQGMKQTFVALALLSIPFILLTATFSVQGTLEPKLATAYGFTFFAGFITTIIMGQTFKTLPFIVWMHLNKPGKLPEMLPKDLYKEALVKLQMFVYLPGFLLFLSGILITASYLLYAGATLMLIASCLYCVHVLFIMNKLRRI